MILSENLVPGPTVGRYLSNMMVNVTQSGELVMWVVPALLPTGVGYPWDGNLAGVGFIIRSGRCCVEGGEETANDSGDGVLHNEGFKI